MTGAVPDDLALLANEVAEKPAMALPALVDLEKEAATAPVVITREEFPRMDTGAIEPAPVWYPDAL